MTIACITKPFKNFSARATFMNRTSVFSEKLVWPLKLIFVFISIYHKYQLSKTNAQNKTLFATLTSIYSYKNLHQTPDASWLHDLRKYEIGMINYSLKLRTNKKHSMMGMLQRRQTVLSKRAFKFIKIHLASNLIYLLEIQFFASAYPSSIFIYWTILAPSVGI